MSPVQPTQFIIGGAAGSSMGSGIGQGGRTGKHGGKGGPGAQDEGIETIHPL